MDKLDSDPSQNTTRTSSYISDDCKVLYIETVIEVSKPVFYERINSHSTSEIHDIHTTDESLKSSNIPTVKAKFDTPSFKRTTNYSRFVQQNMSDNDDKQDITDNDDVETNDNFLLNPVNHSSLNTQPLSSTPYNNRSTSADHPDSGYEPSPNSTIQKAPETTARSKSTQNVFRDDQSRGFRMSSRVPPQNETRTANNDDDEDFSQKFISPMITPKRQQKNDENLSRIINREDFSQTQFKPSRIKSKQEVWPSNSDSSLRNEFKVRRSPNEQQHLFVTDDDSTNSRTMPRQRHQSQIKNQLSSSLNQSTNVTRTTRLVPLSYTDRLRQIWLKSLILGLLILLALFTLYFFCLDSCTQNSWSRNIISKIIRVEHDGLPTM
ncbi:unnamed protein product [Didymodactylos carnosus]|uniref:Uncharacterized protein n=1 Tax=Didymodactylos carnosus TaxID=1234261 RepID=A0A8S2EGQ0_9BILA|nr:unnamed protein product [Didymodactylos carnosus]CAF4027833.1 unnamed protein product [Didymodactylos carnosus]